VGPEGDKPVLLVWFPPMWVLWTVASFFASSPTVAQMPDEMAHDATASPDGSVRVAVVLLPVRGVQPPVASRIRDAVVTMLGQCTPGAAIEALDDVRTQAMGSCSDEACVGALFTDAGVVAGVLMRLERQTPRGPIAMRFAIAQAGSGAAGSEAIEATIDAGHEGEPEHAVGPLCHALAAHLRALTARSTLLLAVNADGAAVRMDEVSVGETPLAPIDVRPGRHVVLIERSGFRAWRGDIEVREGEHARLNADLIRDGSVPDLVDEQEARPLAAGAQADGSDDPWYTRWYVLAGAGAVLVTTLVIVIVVASSGGDEAPTMGIPVPPIQ